MNKSEERIQQRRTSTQSRCTVHWEKVCMCIKRSRSRRVRGSVRVRQRQCVEIRYCLFSVCWAGGRQNGWEHKIVSNSKIALLAVRGRYAPAAAGAYFFLLVHSFLLCVCWKCCCFGFSLLNRCPRRQNSLLAHSLAAAQTNCEKRGIRTAPIHKTCTTFILAQWVRDWKKCGYETKQGWEEKKKKWYGMNRQPQEQQRMNVRCKNERLETNTHI